MNLKGWKTIVFNIISGIMLVITTQADLWGLSPEVVGLATVIGNFVLRFFTSTPVFKNN
jgi:hypothetical protein